MWFIFSLLATAGWGTANLFYKKGADDMVKYSHLITSFFVGLAFGIHAIITLFAFDVPFHPVNLLIYFPASMAYVLSMTIGYFGLRYLDLSISGPIQNSSGAFSCLMVIIFLGRSIDVLSGVGVVLICVSIFWLGIIEKKKQDQYVAEHDRKYKIGFVAFFMPILYCFFDAIGTFLDAYYLDDPDSTPLAGVTADNLENVANTSYELTFFIVGLLMFFYMRVIKKEKIHISRQRDNIPAAIFETLGQYAYIFAMAGKAVIAAPMISSYCIISLILSRIVLKEELSKKQYAVVTLLIAGILLLGISEGLSE